MYSFYDLKINFDLNLRLVKVNYISRKRFCTAMNCKLITSSRVYDTKNIICCVLACEEAIYDSGYGYGFPPEILST